MLPICLHPCNQVIAEKAEKDKKTAHTPKPDPIKFPSQKLKRKLDVIA